MSWCSHVCTWTGRCYRHDVIDTCDVCDRPRWRTWPRSSEMVGHRHHTTTTSTTTSPSSISPSSTSPSSSSPSSFHACFMCVFVRRYGKFARQRSGTVHDSTGAHHRSVFRCMVYPDVSLMVLIYPLLELIDRAHRTKEWAKCDQTHQLCC